MLDSVGLDSRGGDRRPPFEFSGGQCQRICYRSGPGADPKVRDLRRTGFGLDVSVQAQILNLLEDMKVRYGLTMIFIAHDLAVVKNISDRVIVMYLGKICEVAAPDDLYRHPAHPYTWLPSWSRSPNPSRCSRPSEPEVLDGDLPSPLDPPSGCRFRTRCPRATSGAPLRNPGSARSLPGTSSHAISLGSTPPDPPSGGRLQRVRSGL